MEALEDGSGRMLMKDGNSIYLDNTLWTSVSNEVPNAADVLDDVSDSGTDDLAQDVNDEYTVLSSSATKYALTELHPDPIHIFKLWQTFLENVNPLTKIIHAPTVQQKILEAMGDLPKVSREVEVLMFAIYCIALVSMEAEDVEKSFGESKKTLLSKYKRGAQLGFKNAALLRTSSSTVLQAFMLYLLCMRSFSDPHTIWTLCGIAVRIAQRIGIHRDGSAHGLSAFETEMRRRIWLQLILIDATSAQFCGNANDSDLDPRMTVARNKPGATEMIFVLTRSAFGKWLRQLSDKSEGSNTSPWAFLSSPSMSLKEKDKAIDELERHLEDDFLCHCDESIPLHIATTMMARSAICYTRLMAHHPRQYQSPINPISEAEKNVIFEYSLKMTEYADYAQNCSVVRKFSWHMMNHMPWDAIIFMLSELRHRTDHEEKTKVWQLIGDVYSRHIQGLGKKGLTLLHMAIQNLIVKTWLAYVKECDLNGRIQTDCPSIVASLVINATSSQHPRSGRQAQVTESGAESQGQEPSHDFPGSQYVPEFENLEFQFTDSPQDWSDWDNLLSQFQGSLTDDTTYLS
ncbi:hypothetical protein N7461_003485 [Penicillium sp. DV-2018c]|nr:hypothetical protein N7461_003485 [Penicillium sp. DV-2018c]